jgi:hypothetical protein
LPPTITTIGGANLLAYKLRRLGFTPIRYRRLPFFALGPHREFHSAPGAQEVPH